MMIYGASVAAVAICLGPGTRSPLDAPSRSFSFSYRATVKDVAPDAAELRLWVPVPRDTAEQQISNVGIELSADGQIVSSNLDDIERIDIVGQTAVRCTVAEIQHGRGRTLCIETSGEAIGLCMTFDCTRRESQGGGPAASVEERRLALQSDAMIPLGAKVTAMARDLPDGADEMATARTLYDHVLERMRYDKPAGGEWGRGDSEWACDNRYGNCSDFHSYFIGLARSKGIPARFEMGFSIPDGDEPQLQVGGYHCWAFFCVFDHGWVPVDISEADKHPEKSDYFFGRLDENRLTMTGGRDLILTPMPAAGAINFLVYPYLEIDGKDCSNSNVEKSFARTNR